MSRFWRRAALVALGVALISITTGCAEERDPINRVQANALAKSFFVGTNLLDPGDDPEFWTQATLIDAPYGVSNGWLFPSTFSQAPARIKWQITEELLIGRLTYELINDADGKGAGPSSTDGQVILAYRISSHFDIRRAYNPSTGEELNVVEENGSDRAWYEREYFRVDWSQNLQTDTFEFDTLSMFGFYDGVQYSSLAYYVNDPSDPDAPYFDVSNGYFDVTNKAFAIPKMIDLSSMGWGISEFPACWLPDEFMGGSWPKANCNPSEITLRIGFRRVVDTDYEPMDWDGYRFQAYGAFLKERLGYERNYGMTDEHWHRFITRYNVWERSHYYDDPESMTGPVECFTPESTPWGQEPNRDDDHDGTADECVQVTDITGVAGSQCDEFKQKCTLPYRLRVPKPLAWYFTSGSNMEYWDGSAWATHDWDVALRHSIQVAKYAECVGTSQDPDPGSTKFNCAQANPVYFGQMDYHLEAKMLARDVDACRANGGGESCLAVADQKAVARGYDPTDGMGDDLSDLGLIRLAQMPEMIVLCHSPVQANDPETCGPPEVRLPADVSAADCARAEEERDAGLLATCRGARYARRGDMRYHLINIFYEPHTPSPWGIYTDAEDPLTGETFSATVNVWTHVNDLWSQMVMDRIRLIKGELSSDQITEAENVNDWAIAAEAAETGGVLGHLSKDQFLQRISNYGHIAPEELEERMANMPPQLREVATQTRDKLKGVRASIDAPSRMAPIYEARRARAAGTEVEATLMDPMMQEFSGMDEMPLNGAAMNYASLLRGNNPSLQRQMRQFKESALAKHGTCIMYEAPIPQAVTGMADVLEQKFQGQYGPFNPGDDKATQQARAEVMRKYVAQRAHYAVIVHEMGHSMAARHNFVSSSDPWGYRPQYWQLRTKDGTQLNSCPTYTENGDACVGPRYYDPVTEEERVNMIAMWQHSSVMDYAGDYTQDMLGLAAWDFAGARSWYGDVVAVFDDPSYNQSQPRGQGMISKIDDFGGITGIGYSISGADIHYTGLQENYELIKNCREVDPYLWQPDDWDATTKGDWHPVFDGLIVNVNGRYTKCEQQKVDYVPWRQLREPGAEPFPDKSCDPFSAPGLEFVRAYQYRSRCAGVGVDKHGRVRVPYGFASDGWADIGNASVYRHDNGADSFELFDFLITNQEVNHIFDNYRRGRTTFSVKSAASRTLGRFNEKIRDGAKGIGLYANLYRTIFLEMGWDFEEVWPQVVGSWFPQNILAASYTFDHFARTLDRPETGHHWWDADDGVFRSDQAMEPRGIGLTIPNGGSGYPGVAGNSPFGNVGFGGKLVENRLCETCGEYDRDYTMNSGSYYDKVYAPYLMTESVDNFISDSLDDFTDGRYRAVSLADLFPEGFRRWMANNLTGDEWLKGPRVAGLANQNAENPPLSQACTAYVASLNPLYDDLGEGCASCCGDNDDPWEPPSPASSTFAGTNCTCFGGPDVQAGQDADGNLTLYPTHPLGWVSWWGAEPDICFPAAGTPVCRSQGGGYFGDIDPNHSFPIDGQVGFDNQKFLINWTMLYLPENEKQKWINHMRVWEIGLDADPGFANRIEFHDPYGKIFVAKTFGKEDIFGKTVQKGIAARVLEYANELLVQSYQCTDGPDLDGDGAPDWYVPEIDPMTGEPIVLPDPVITTSVNPRPCSANRYCVRLENYTTIPYYLRQVMGAYGLIDPEMEGVFE